MSKPSIFVLTEDIDNREEKKEKCGRCCILKATSAQGSTPSAYRSMAMAAIPAAPKPATWWLAAPVYVAMAAVVAETGLTGAAEVVVGAADELHAAQEDD